MHIPKLLAGALRNLTHADMESKAYRSASHVASEMVRRLESMGESSVEEVHLLLDSFDSQVVSLVGDGNIQGEVLYDPLRRRIDQLEKAAGKGVQKKAASANSVSVDRSSGGQAVSTCRM